MSTILVQTPLKASFQGHTLFKLSPGIVYALSLALATMSELQSEGADARRTQD